MSITSVFSIGPFVPCTPLLCKILNTPVMSICLVKQNDGTWVEKINVFRLDALAKALSVIATATWLGGWLGVRHTPVLYQNG